MRHRTQISRADLLECLHAYGEAHLEGMAAVLGYEREVKKLPEKVRVSASISAIIPAPLLRATGTVAAPKARFYRVVANRLLEPEEVVRDEPAWFRNAEPFREEDELRAPVNASPPPQPPLLPWSRLWPFLKMALGAWQTTQTLDLPRIIARLARAQTLRYLPRQQRHGWASECQLIIDYAEPLLPFWNDFNQLHRRLRQLRGVRGLRLIAFPDGDPGGRCWWHDGREWREYASGSMPNAGAMVLVLGDLGCNDSSDVRRRQWRHLGARLRRVNRRPVALMPCPPRRWDGELTRLFYLVCWDRAARLPRGLGARRIAPAAAERGESDSGAERLLALLAPAIRIEPALLRAVRYLLPIGECDVGSEAAAWNHPRVHPTPLAFYYDREAIAGYRRAFQEQDAALRQQIAELIAAHHAHLSPTIGHEERSLLANLENACDLQARRFMERIVRTLHDRNDAIVDSAQAWVGRLTPRQHEAMWQDEALAAAWGTAHLTQLRAGTITPPLGLDLSRISWLLGQDRTLKRYTLRQRGPALYLEADAPAALASELDAPGSPVAELSAITPHVQLQRLESDGTVGQELIQPLSQAILLPASGRLRLRTDHQALILNSIERPEWAEAIGRDEQGLFVAWQDGQRRARWVNPGSYPVHNRVGERLGPLKSVSGYWRDEAEARAQLREGFSQPDWAEDYGLDEYGLYADIHIQGVAQRLRWIIPGEFLMGSPESEEERYDDEIQHWVILTQGYWLADTACTQALWQAVMSDNPSQFRGEDRPVENVSWDDTQRFIERLNERVPGGGFRLPTEAEWEYACRAGTTTTFWFGDQISPEQANYDGNHPYAGGPQGLRRKETVAVKALPCNGWGLYQMHGNVWEWCQDWFDAYPAATVIDPTGSAEGDWRVLRGGSWFAFGTFVRSAYRFRVDFGSRYVGGGFRLARGQAARQDGLEARAASEINPSVPEASEAGEKRGVGQVLRDLWNRIKPS